VVGDRLPEASQMFARGQIMGLKQRVCFRSAFIAAAILLLAALRAPAQTTGVAPRITQAVDEKNLVVLQGNVHPRTRTALNLGAVSDAQPLTRMLLLLKRSPDQESALLRLLDDQHTKSSPNYHKWLTPEQFGQQFGPADADIQAVTDWLQSQGFQVTQVTKGRTVIEFSGNVAQIRNALHTQIQRYAVNGEEHLANATDPQIPATLAPVVAGVVSLHDFRPVSHFRHVGAFHRSKVTGEVTPLFTPSGSSTFFPLAPADFAKIYNVAPLLNASPPVDGSGQTIAIVGESNIQVQDIVDFRTLFGLPQNFTGKNVIVNGPDPGINGSEGESDLDIQWAGAVAPGATIDFVTSAPTETTSGVHLSAVHVVDNNLAGVMSESFGQCEQNLGSAGNQFYYSLWEQAAAQGITVILSAGDGGSAGCDNFNTQQTAKQGLAVSGLASTPFNVAVGGTDFDQVNRWSQYWNLTNDPVTHASVKSYIPEIPWNDSCAQLGINGCGASAPQGSLNIVAGSGGPSTLYPKPAWQSSAGVPQDNKRDLPDVSLFASTGFTGSLYIICQSDVVNPPNPSCNLNNIGFTFQGFGGTSAAAPAFAGMMALVNQKQATLQNPTPRQGNANYVLYALARKQAAANLSCNSSAGPDLACTFNDVTKGNSALANSSVGNNSVPCLGGSPNCSSGASSVNGVLVDPANRTNPAWTTNAGYDLATGLGSVNAQNLVNNWNSITFLPSTTTLSVSINGNSVSSISGLVHGQPISVTSTVAPGPAVSGTPAGQVSLIASPNPATGSPSPSLGIGVLTLANGTATATNVVLPGGTYALMGHYQGDGSFGPSDSSPAIPVNITAESSKALISIPVFDPASGKETDNTPSSVVYGSPYIARIDVGNAQAALFFPQQPICNPPNCPTGTITLTDAYNGGAPVALDGGTFALNSAGFTEDFLIQLSGGLHQLSTSYSGDSSFNASSSTYSLSVTPAPTTTTSGNPPLPPVVTTPFAVSAIVRSQSSGAMPSCNVTFFEGSTPLPGTVTCTGQPGGATYGAFLQPWLVVSPTTSGSHTYTAKFNGDSNYGVSTSAPMTTQVFYGTNTTLTVSSSTMQYGTSVTLTAIVDTSLTQGPAIRNAVSFGSGAGPVSGTVTYTAITDASGNLALQATLTTTPQYSTYYYATFAGDTNYSGSSSTTVVVTVNIPGFSVAANPTSLAVTAGQSGTATVTVTPASNATSPVTLSCYSVTVPAGATCNFSPSTVTLSNGSTATATLTLTTLPPSASPTVSLAPLKPPTFFPLFSGWQGLRVAAGLLAVILLIRPRRSRRYRIAMGLASVCIFGHLIGCGGGSGGGGGVGGGPLPTSVSLTTSGTKVPITAPLTFQAKVSSSRTVTGPVTFYDQGSALGVVNVLSNGTATLQAIGLSIGTHVITASYSGDTNNLPSKTSGSLNQVITGDAPLLIFGTTGGLTNQTAVLVTIQ
jgi:hypothetical protein